MNERMPIAYMSPALRQVLDVLKVQVAPISVRALTDLIGRDYPELILKGMNVPEAIATLTVGGHAVRSVDPESGEMVYRYRPVTSVPATESA